MSKINAFDENGQVIEREMTEEELADDENGQVIEREMTEEELAEFTKNSELEWDA